MEDLKKILNKLKKFYKPWNYFRLRLRLIATSYERAIAQVYLDSFVTITDHNPKL